MIITLCGSTRFKHEFQSCNSRLTLQGHIVLSVGVFAHADNIILSKGEKQMLDKIHRDKIDLSDAIYVINKQGYIGTSTKSEINYALLHGKQVLVYDKLNYRVKDFTN